MPRYILDTNLLRVALNPQSLLSLRMAKNPEAYFLSVISVREAMRGILASISEGESPNNRSPLSLSARYENLLYFMMKSRVFSLHPYSENAEILYKGWPENVKRIGPNDCRIAASAITGSFVVLTRNRSDFSRIALHDDRLEIASDLEELSEME